MASLIVKITGDASGFKGVADSITRDLNSISSRAEKVGGSISSLGSTLSVGLSAPLLALGGVAVKASADMDSLRRALVTTTGSASEASKQFARLEEIAKLPAIGLEEAVRGSIRLQNYGLSAELAEKAMRGFSNAIGSSGGSADDTNEALRQLGQTFGRQKVTMDNLRIILERVPQAAKIIREEFGSAALADPATALEKLGVNSEQFVTVLINRLNEAHKVAPGLKTEIENLGQEFQKTAAAAGDQLAPAIKDMIGYMSDGLKTVADFAKGFADMPKPVQQIGLAFGAFLVTAPLVVTAVGTIITNFGVIAGAAGTIGTAIAGFATTIGTYGAATSAAVGLMAGAWVAGAAVAVYSIGTLTSAFYQLYAAQSKLDQSTNDLAFSTEKLLERVRKQHPEVGALELQYRSGKLSAEDFSAELRRLASGMESTTVQGTASKPVIKGLGEKHGKAAEAVEKHAKAMESAKLPTMELLALFDRFKDSDSKKAEAVK
jgi:tape measure domain-containing protein